MSQPNQQTNTLGMTPPQYPNQPMPGQYPMPGFGAANQGQQQAGQQQQQPGQMPPFNPWAYPPYPFYPGWGQPQMPPGQQPGQPMNQQSGQATQLQPAMQPATRQQPVQSTAQPGPPPVPAKNKAVTTPNNQQAQNKKADPNKDFPKFEFDRYFLGWLREVNTGMLVSSYKTGHVFSFGLYQNPDKPSDSKLSMWMTAFTRPMGLHASRDQAYISSSGNIWGYKNYGRTKLPDVGEFDGNFVPQTVTFSNDVDVHDLVVDAEDQLYFVSASFCCICQPSETHSFKVYWKPPWISRVVPEDRCHLNGMCVRDGKVRYVTSATQTDVRNGWRGQRVGKGIIYDIVEERVVCSGLTMPHSPRWWNGKLWLLEAGTGQLGYVDVDAGDETFHRCQFIPGFARGLSFVNEKYALVGCSQDRHETTFQDLPVGDQLKEQEVESKCAVYVINLEDFSIQHNLIFYSPIDEIYDVVAIPAVSRPRLADVGDDKNLRDYKLEWTEHCPDPRLDGENQSGESSKIVEKEMNQSVEVIDLNN